MEYILQPKPDGTKKKTTRLRDFHLAGWAYASKYRWQDTKQRHMKNDALNASLVTCDEPTTMSAQAGVGVVRRPKKTPHKNKLELPLSIVFQTLMRAADIDGRMPDSPWQLSGVWSRFFRFISWSHQRNCDNWWLNNFTLCLNTMFAHR